MGHFYRYSCSQCGFELELHEGVGMSFPETGQEWGAFECKTCKMYFSENIHLERISCPTLGCAGEPKKIRLSSKRKIKCPRCKSIPMVSTLEGLWD
jgi:DNA-directed RNA polymerase subunit RPC12/RpoP